MSKKILELAAAANITDTSTQDSGGTSTIYADLGGQAWKEKVIQYGEALRYFDQVCIVDKTMVGTGIKSVTIPVSTSNLAITTSNTEGDVRTITEMTDLDGVTLTVSGSSFKRGVISITKEIFMTSTVDLIAQARYKIAQALAQDVDVDIATALQDTSVSNRVYGGSATNPGNLATGCTMTPDLVIDAAVAIEANNFEPYVLYLHPYQVRELRKDPQFTNAAEYGGNEVVLKGEIGMYQGIKIIKTTNAPTYASGTTDTNQTSYAWAVDGHLGIMVGRNRDGTNAAAAIAWKEMPSIDYEYEKDESLHKIYYDQCYVVDVVQPNAICLVYTSDA